MTFGSHTADASRYWTQSPEHHTSHSHTHNRVICCTASLTMIWTRFKQFRESYCLKEKKKIGMLIFIKETRVRRWKSQLKKGTQWAITRVKIAVPKFLKKRGQQKRLQGLAITEHRVEEKPWTDKKLGHLSARDKQTRPLRLEETNVWTLLTERHQV